MFNIKYCHNNIGSMIESLEHCICDQHVLGSKPTNAILLCLWERHFPCLVVLANSSKLEKSYLYQISSRQ